VVSSAVATALVLAFALSPLHHAARPHDDGGGACPAIDAGCRPLILDTGILVSSAGRFRIGQPGDVVVEGRWTCRSALPALLRPATGEVFEWDSWATTRQDAPSRRIETVTGARTLEVQQRTSTCDRLLARRADGGLVAVRTGP
jgi:hypothetical protein